MPVTPDAPSGPVEVTVVLPVRNEGAHVEAVLGDLLAQDFPFEKLEILVVDGGSTDDTRARVGAVAARDSRVRLLDNPRRLSSAGRAIGATAARGRFIAYVDGHCRIESRRLIADMVDLFERTGADGLARPQPLVATGGGLVARAIAAARTSRFGHSLASEIFGDKEARVRAESSGAMYRREVFDRIGPFDPAFDACEDVELNYRFDRAGLVAWTSGRLAVRYEPRRAYGALFRQMRRYGLGRARLHRKHPSAFSWESLVPAAFVLGVPVLLAAPWLPAPLTLAVALGYGLYGALAVAFGILAARKDDLSLLPLILLAFPVIHAGLGVGYLHGRFGPWRPEVPVGGPRARAQVESGPSDSLEPLYTRVIKSTAARLRRDRAPQGVVAVERRLSLPRDAMRRRQFEAVRSLLMHARDTVPWYRERMAAAGFSPLTMRSLEDLAVLPPLTRYELSGEPGRLLSCRYRSRALVEARTGGTTSAAVPFVQTRGSFAWKDAAALALKRRMGWRPGHKSAFLWGAAQDGPATDVDWVRRTRDRLRLRFLDRALWLPAGELSDDRLDEHADRLLQFQPRVLQAYPSAADLLARRLLARGRRLEIPIVLLTAEPVLPEQRERVAAALGAEVFTFYGARECGWIASECRAEHRLHVNTACVHLERGADGSLLVTDLVNRAMPLIRYVIGDRGTLDSAPCPCGDASPTIASLEGRLNDVFTLPSGRRVPGVVADLRAYRIGLGILEAQLVQETLKQLDVFWVGGPQYQPGDENVMRERLDRMFFGELSIRLERVERLQASPNGKVRYCISRVGSPTG